MIDNRRTYYFFYFQTVKYHTGIYFADAYVEVEWYPRSSIHSIGITYFEKVDPFYKFDPPEIYEVDLYMVERNEYWANRDMKSSEQISMMKEKFGLNK